jgi:hypothetical protein
MNETELREMIKLLKGVVHYMERCLKSEKEKNEERLKKQLENSGVSITDESCTCYIDLDGNEVLHDKYNSACPQYIEIDMEEFEL